MTVRTLLEIIRADWTAAGNTGPLTRAYLDAWHLANPVYGGGGWPLWVRFSSGSRVAVIGLTHLDRASAAWTAAGHPWSAATFGSAAFEAFEAARLDEYDDEFYDRPAVEVKKVAGKGKRAKR